MSPENGSSSNLRFVIRFGQLLAQCNSDWQMKHSPNGGFKFFLFFSKESSSSFKSFLSASVKSLFREAK